MQIKKTIHKGFAGSLFKKNLNQKFRLNCSVDLLVLINIYTKIAFFFRMSALLLTVDVYRDVFIRICE